MAPVRVLDIAFDSEEAFRAEYRSNIANGGIFVATDEPLEVREPVRVRIDLGFCEGRLELAGEVVHVVPTQMAVAGATPGVAVHFELTASEIRDRLQEWVPVDPEVEEQKRPSGRRRAPRTAARLRAEVEDGQQTRLRGRTRNLSAAGVLVDCAGDCLPLGTRVGLTLTHPLTGEKRPVSGRVVRHQTGPDGSILGMAVEFDGSESDREDLARFVADVKSGEHSRRLGGIRGDIAEVGIEGIVQMLAASAPQGVLSLTRGGEEGTLVFQGGELRAVVLGAQRGTKALASLLAWREGQFEFHSHLDEAPDDWFDQEALSVEAALLDAARWADEQRRDGATAAEKALDDALVEEILAEAGTDLDQDDDLDPAAILEWRASPDAALSETEESLRDLARVGMSVGKAIAVIPESDDEVRAVLARLVRRGMVVLR